MHVPREPLVEDAERRSIVGLGLPHQPGDLVASFVARVGGDRQNRHSPRGGLRLYTDRRRDGPTVNPPSPGGRFAPGYGAASSACAKRVWPDFIRPGSSAL